MDEKVSLVPPTSNNVVTVLVDFTYRDTAYYDRITVPEHLYLTARQYQKCIPYPAFITNPLQKEFYPYILSSFQVIRDEEHLTSDEYADLLIAYVQSLPYDWKKVREDNITPRFPIETCIDRTGICTDKSLLLAGLLAWEGYNVVLLEFTQEHHMAVAISVPQEYSNWDSGYAFIETTSLIPIGDLTGTTPEGQRLCTPPNIIAFPCGSTSYAGMELITKINKARNILQEKVLPELVHEVRQYLHEVETNRTYETVSQYNDVVTRHNAVVHILQDIQTGILSREEILSRIKNAHIGELQQIDL